MTKDEALKLCEKYKVDHTKHPHIVVTSNGNIYTSGKVDPSDKSEQIKLNGEPEEPKETTEAPESNLGRKGKRK